jgi:hypothetical protein
MPQLSTHFLEMAKAVLSEDTMKFTAKDATFECNIGQAIALSPAFREQLSVDACARTFELKTVCMIDSVRRLLSCDSVSTGESQTDLGCHLGNPGLELELSGTDRLDLNSIDLSILSVEALDEFLSKMSFCIDSEDDLLDRLLNLGDDYCLLLKWVDIRFLSVASLATLSDHFAFPTDSLWPPFSHRLIRISSLGSFDSVIVCSFPAIFAEFRHKRFSLLWRGSRDGFGARDFHNRCDGHANTLTVILDTNGNIFGCFTPTEWESRKEIGSGRNCHKSDPTLKSFQFTLRNPHNFPPRRFSLNTNAQDHAITCRSQSGPCFGGIAISDNCNANTESSAFLGITYMNDTGISGERVFTSSAVFKVNEIEVFQIAV